VLGNENGVPSVVDSSGQSVVDTQLQAAGVNSALLTGQFAYLQKRIKYCYLILIVLVPMYFFFTLLAR